MKIQKVKIQSMRGIYEQIIEKLKGSEKRAASERPPQTKEVEISNTRLKYENINQIIKNSSFKSRITKDLRDIKSQIEANPYINIKTGTESQGLPLRYEIKNRKLIKSFLNHGNNLSRQQPVIANFT